MSAEEYGEFYRHLAHDWTDPLETISLRAEGTFEYQALLFIPSRAPMDLFMRDAKRGVQLYVKRVFIMDDCEALMPEYLRFVKGVVDAADLSLNVSREILQADRHIARMRRRLVRKVLSSVKDLMTEKPEVYATFWTEFGRAVKEGLLNDPDHRDEILAVCSFDTTFRAVKEGAEGETAEPAPTTLAAYKERMVQGQEAIYYLTGESRTAIESSPHLEGLRAKGFEVLVLTDPIDEIWVDAVGEFDGTSLQSVAKGQVDLQSEEEKSAAQEREADFADLLGWLGSALGGDVKQVRLSTRLTTSPACVVGDANDVTPTLEKMYRAMGQELPPVKRILELNPTHPLVVALHDAYASGEEAERGSLAETAEVLYDLALLAEGGDLGDPARFVRLVADRLQQGLGATG